MLKKDLEHLKDLVGHFDERKSRAKERLEKTTGSWWCFALLGFSMEPDEYAINSILSLRPVQDPPGEIELAGALHDKSLMSSVARYSSGVHYELAVNADFGSQEDSPFTLAWWFLSALRVRTLAEVLVPMASNHSWSVIAGAADSTVMVRLIEDVPRARRLDPPKIVTTTDLDWISHHLNMFASLLEVPKFRLAVEALTTHHQEASLRMTVAALWAGIEALFEVQNELRFRLAIYVAALLEPRGSSRIELFNSMKKLYDFRSKAVHGVSLGDDQLSSHVRAVRTMLSRLLCTIIEAGGVPSIDDLDSKALG